ncbi:hypothetical protein CH373_14700 [Leptospira perolatii]|uniref:Lipoprotein n=1 Tax=Leptospira perolatii TaxID=2023191 RepID=A0A2M9ZJZ9_9LEPT|nr:hypothetical protein [Leptospira perolatii]PJZ69223.1 hypothetical protein CH360_11920 [Leptospira perolatii]PJZ72395.1 hypothetical protein CH373_14700 [Leptospira perolatii]
MIRKVPSLIFCVIYSLVIFTMSCQQGKGKDHQTELQMLALLPSIQVRYRTQASGGNFSLNSSSTYSTGVLTTNISGINIADYGDGISDGFTDRFLTPVEVYLGVNKIIAWKSPANGGPASGQETESNASITLLECIPQNPTHPGEFCTYSVVIGDSEAARNTQAFLANWARLPDASYDRIGVLVPVIRYVFDSQVIEPNLRWVNTNFRFNATDVYADLRMAGTSNSGLENDCPEYLSEMLDVLKAGKTCESRGYGIDEANGKIGYGGGYNLRYPLATNNSPGTFLTRDNPINNITTASGDYVLIVSGGESLSNAYNLYIDVDPTNAFFWDSNTSSTSYDATLDGPNGTTKQIKYYLPAIQLNFQ